MRVFFLYITVLILFFAAKSFAGISTHVLNLSNEKTLENMEIDLEYFENQKWKKQSKQKLDINGRASIDIKLKKGMYKLIFKTSDFLEYNFYPLVEVIFNVSEESEHYHIPLSLSEFGYSTYKGQFPKKK